MNTSCMHAFTGVEVIPDTVFEIPPKILFGARIRMTSKNSLVTENNLNARNANNSMTNYE